MAPFSWLGLVLLLTPGEAAVEADVLIRGVTLHDGSGKPAVVGDLALSGDRIAAVGRFTVKGQPHTIDGAGLLAAPGFIDLHVHGEDALTRAPTRGNANYLLQGVTTVVTGNCGLGPVRWRLIFAPWNAAASAATSSIRCRTTTSAGPCMNNANRRRPPTELATWKCWSSRA